jgi:LPXTG-motif cell wall-anchored protein
MAVTTIARRVLATGAIAGTALLALTIPASAHNHGVKAGCADETSYLHVDLNSYNGDKTNTVKVTVDGQAQAEETFKSNWSKHWDDLDATKTHTYTVDVHAGDDENGQAGFTFKESGEIKACVEAPPTTTTTTTVAPTTTTSEAPAPSTTKPAPPKDQGGLANTGASVGLPIGIGALLLVGGGALLLVVRKRRSAA